MSEVTIMPKASFVVKSRFLNGTKVFINVCSAEEVPLPEVPYNPSVVYPLIMNNQWEIPIVTSDMREDIDKKGAPSAVFDCVIHPRALLWIQQDDQLREILTEWCLESVELRSGAHLSREHIAFPKMLCKGTLQMITVHKKELRSTSEVQREIAKLQDEPMTMLNLGRLDEELGSVETSAVDIFGAGEKGSGKPLIQEISEMQISPLETIKKDSKKNGESPPLQFETTMEKININGFKLRITIKSQIDTSLDYNLLLDSSSSTLILQNTNENYLSKDLKIPLPFESPTVKAFFTHDKLALIIFAK